MNLKELDGKLFDIWESIYLLKYVDPTNQKEEKKKFMSSESYNPQFKYKEIDIDVKKIKKQLESYRKFLDKSNMSTLIGKQIDKLDIWLSMLGNRGKSEFTKSSIAYFGKPDKSLIKKAKKLMMIKLSGESELDVSSKDVVKYLKKQVKLMGLDWYVGEKSNIGARATILPHKRILYIKKGEFFSKIDLKRLTVHELGVHAVRATNALKQEYKLFLMGTFGYEVTEEGLAVLAEIKNKVLEDKTLKSYGGRVVAVDLALKNSFREVYNYLLKYFSSDESYQLSMRVKRGIFDTSKEGAFTKDYIYLEGMEKLKGLKNIKPLFMGRIGVDDLKLIS